MGETFEVGFVVSLFFGILFFVMRIGIEIDRVGDSDFVNIMLIIAFVAVGVFGILWDVYKTGAKDAKEKETEQEEE